MKPIILRRNASPVYSFLSLMNDLNDGETLVGKKNFGLWRWRGVASPFFVCPFWDEVVWD